MSADELRCTAWESAARYNHLDAHLTGLIFGMMSLRHWIINSRTYTQARTHVHETCATAKHLIGCWVGWLESLRLASPYILISVLYVNECMSVSARARLAFERVSTEQCSRRAFAHFNKIISYICVYMRMANSFISRCSCRACNAWNVVCSLLTTYARSALEPRWGLSNFFCTSRPLPSQKRDITTKMQKQKTNKFHWHTMFGAAVAALQMPMPLH